MIRGFIEQQEIRRLHQCLDYGQALLPATGERIRFRFDIVRPGVPQGLGQARSPLPLVKVGAVHRTFNHRPRRRSRLEFRILLHKTDAEPFPERYFSFIRSFFGGQDSQQGGLAGTVRTDEPDAVAFRHRERHILKERL